MGPNDARHVVWAWVSFFFFFVSLTSNTNQCSLVTFWSVTTCLSNGARDTDAVCVSSLWFFLKKNYLFYNNVYICCWMMSAKRVGPGLDFRQSIPDHSSKGVSGLKSDTQGRIFFFSGESKGAPKIKNLTWGRFFFKDFGH